MKILIRGGMLIDGLGGREDNLEWLEIKDGFIVRIDKKGSSTVPQAHEEADQIIEAQGLAVCPGLINAHLHLYLDGGKSPLHDLAQEKSHLSLLKAAARAKKVLHNGVTTVSSGSVVLDRSSLPGAVTVSAGATLRLSNPSGLTGAYYNVLINLPNISDEVFREDVKRRAQMLLDRAQKISSEIAAFVVGELGKA